MISARSTAAAALAFSLVGCNSGGDAPDPPSVVQVATTPTTTCPDGTTVSSGTVCPTKPSGPPAPTSTPTTAIPVSGPEGAQPVADNFDTYLSLQTSWNPTGAPSGAPDVVGAFRFICSGDGQLLYDAAITLPNQPGKSHLHQFFGNTKADAYSTYASLRASGDSTCAWTGAGITANRSSYWLPALLNGQGQVVRPDFLIIYYKRRPRTDPVVADPSHPRFEGQATSMPNGLQFIFGRDLKNFASAPTGNFGFRCLGGADQSRKSNLEELQSACPAQHQFAAEVEAPSCWDGKNLDVADHRSHLAYAGYGWWGYLKCPTTHPYVIPAFTMIAAYSQAPGETYSFSSDPMNPTGKRGETLHGALMMAWSPTVHKMWEDHCIDQLLNCSGGDLGNGRQIRGAAQPPYGWTNPNRLVPVPPKPTASM